MFFLSVYFACSVFAANAAQAGEPEVVSVEVEGVGSDRDTALRVAWDKAVRSVVGTIVDSETLVRNDQLIADEILTYSNGFIASYDLLREWTDAENRVHVRLDAKVARGKVSSRLTELHVTEGDVDSGSLRAQLSSKTKKAKEGRARLERALRPFIRASYIRAGDPIIDNVAANGRLAVTVPLSFDNEAYQAALEKLEAVLIEVGATETPVRYTSGAPVFRGGRAIFIRRAKNIGETRGLKLYKLEYRSFILPETLEDTALESALCRAAWSSGERSRCKSGYASRPQPMGLRVSLHMTDINGRTLLRGQKYLVSAPGWMEDPRLPDDCDYSHCLVKHVSASGFTLAGYPLILLATNGFLIHAPRDAANVGVAPGGDESWVDHVLKSSIFTSELKLTYEFSVTDEVLSQLEKAEVSITANPLVRAELNENVNESTDTSDGRESNTESPSDIQKGNRATTRRSGCVSLKDGATMGIFFFVLIGLRIRNGCS